VAELRQLKSPSGEVGPFLVELEAFTCFGNCIWDALGIAAMMKQDARIKTACGDCGIALELTVEVGQVKGDAGIIHFALPARRWWEDIVFQLKDHAFLPVGRTRGSLVPAMEPANRGSPEPGAGLDPGASLVRA
jgi:hypothetical protein